MCVDAARTHLFVTWARPHVEGTSLTPSLCRTAQPRPHILDKRNTCTVWVSCTQTSTNTGDMRGMCDGGERITKGVGGIRVSCYDPVTLLEHGRMRLLAQQVNKGGGHICKTHRWPHGASGHLGSHLALRPLGELWCPPGASWHLRYGTGCLLNLKPSFPAT